MIMHPQVRMAALIRPNFDLVIEILPWFSTHSKPRPETKPFFALYSHGVRRKLPTLNLLCTLKKLQHNLVNEQ